VEYYAGSWNDALFMETTFWGAAGFADRWAVMDANPANGKIAVLEGKYNGEMFSVEGEMYGRDVEMRLTNSGEGGFTWELLARTDSGEYEPMWTRHYVKLTSEDDIAAARAAALGGLQLHTHETHMEPLDFWVGEWDWHESHVDMPGECAEGQALITYTNGGDAIEERAVSSYDPNEANAPTYADYSLTMWNEELGEFENYWWTNGALSASYSHGACTGSGGDKVCRLRADFHPSADGTTIIWELPPITITWLRK
jgi:hypothetical protein